MPVVDAPPVRERPPAAPKPVRETATLKARREAVGALGQLAQVPLIATRQYADVGALSLYWPSVADELAKLAESDERIAQVIDPLCQIGPYAGLITAILPLLLQVAVNHGAVAPGAMGTVPASTLAAQVETGLAQQELQALQVQAQAEEDARRMRADIEKARAEFNGTREHE